MKITLESIVRILFWISLFILVFLLAWLVLGASPRVEQISLGIALVGIPLAAFTVADIRFLKKVNTKQLELLEEHTEILKDIRDILKRR